MAVLFLFGVIKMKKILCILLAFITALFICFPVFADGDPNMDGGGGGVDNGDTQGGSYWNIGEDGVRVTVVKESTRTCVTKPLDFSNMDTTSINKHFGRKCKLQYGNLQPSTDKYYATSLNSPIPQVVSSNGSNNIETVKNYFRDNNVIKLIAIKTGFDYDKLINGNYVLLIEPVLYYRYNGAKFAATATEVAIYDQMANGDLKSKLGYATHQNLPLSMFLEIPQLGYSAYSGPTSGVLDDATIIDQLGLGIVNFKEPVPDEPKVSTYDYEYRTDTDVITSVRIYAGGEINPDDNASVVFSVLGKTYTKSYVIPAGESQLVWFKWHTPKEPKVVNIHVSASDGSAAKETISCNVVKLEEKTPPNPAGRDRNDSFKKVNAPSYPTKKTATWGEWHAYWVPVWVWVSDHDEDGGGHWEDHGHWAFEWYSYSAKLVPTMEIAPDEKVPTDIKKYSSFEMKSGYGYDIKVTTSVGSDRDYDVTQIQNVVTLFPEFGYKTYDRLLEATRKGYYSEWEFKKNKYSMTKQRVHFTPIWYPDSSYKTYIIAFDAWTPDGQLVAQDTFDFEIDGDVYDDWVVVPQEIE